MEYFRDRFIDELNAEGEIEVAGNTWSRHEILEGMDADAEKDVFRDWVDRTKRDAIERTREFLTETNCLDRFRTLSHRFRGGNVVPFVGAGMSRSSGFPLWTEFLQSLTREAPAVGDRVLAYLAQGDFEEAAQVIADALGPNILGEGIQNQFGEHRRQIVGPVALLPALFRGEVLTTNFDYVLDEAYRSADHPFAQTFSGSGLRSAPMRIGNQPHCLLRLHGEGEVEEGRVLTRAEYNAAYGEGRSLAGVLSAIISLRSFLFLGCSLQADRTVTALQTLRQAAAPVQPPRHYALLPLPADGEREARRQFLSEAEIHPIYYPPGDHDQYIEDMLITLMEGGIE